MDPLELALEALEDAHGRYLRSARAHVAALLDQGLTPAEVEEWLQAIDKVEAEQDAQRALLRLVA